MIDKIVMEMMVKNITEKIIEQEKVYNSMDGKPKLQQLIRDRITNLEVERNTYLRILKVYDI